MARLGRWTIFDSPFIAPPPCAPGPARTSPPRGAAGNREPPRYARSPPPTRAGNSEPARPPHRTALATPAGGLTTPTQRSAEADRRLSWSVRSPRCPSSRHLSDSITPECFGFEPSQPFAAASFEAAFRGNRQSLKLKRGPLVASGGSLCRKVSKGRRGDTVDLSWCPADGNLPHTCLGVHPDLLAGP